MHWAGFSKTRGCNYRLVLLLDLLQLFQNLCIQMLNTIFAANQISPYIMHFWVMWQAQLAVFCLMNGLTSKEPVWCTTLLPHLWTRYRVKYMNSINLKVLLNKFLRVHPSTMLSTHVYLRSNIITCYDQSVRSKVSVVIVVSQVVHKY